jgi:DNA polymerase V
MQKELDFESLEDNSEGSGYTSGFPNPVEDYMYSPLHLDKILIKNPAATFYARVEGNNMLHEGIAHGDLLIVDKSLNLYDNCLVVCYPDGDFTVRRVKITKKNITLLPANEKQKPIYITEENNHFIWGVISYLIKKIYHPEEIQKV